MPKKSWRACKKIEKMTLELIICIASVLFGIVLYWRAYRGNKIYWVFNKLMNFKELQMEFSDTKEFVNQQLFSVRIGFITAFFLIRLLRT